MEQTVSDKKKPSKLPIETAITFPSPAHRPTRRPTVQIKSIDPNRFQEALLGAFRRFNVHSMDMEALIYFSLQSFPDINPDEFEEMQKFARQHIMRNFAINQSGPLRLMDFSMYRLSVCYTDDTDV